MSNLTESNLITLDTELKQGQRCIRIGNSIIPVGVGGISAPGAGGADVTLGVVDSQGRFQALRFNGTQASNSGSAIQVQDYKTWNSTLPAPQPAGVDMDFYKCASVDASDSAWTGYKAVLSSGKYSYESTVTSGLTYGSSFTPEVGKVYSDGALIQATLYQGGIPLDGVLCYAMPDTSWVAGQSVSTWGDFSQSDINKQPQLATIGGVTGIKVRNGDQLYGSASAPSGDFSFLAKFYVGDTSTTDMSLIKFNSWLGAIMTFGRLDQQDMFVLSKQGESYIGIMTTMLSLGTGQHTAACTYEQSTGTTKFYFDGVLTETEVYNADFNYSGEFYYDQEAPTSDNLILGLAAYNRVLSAAEIAGINW